MSIQEKESLYEIGCRNTLEFIPKRLNSVDTEAKKMVTIPKT
tara:strand:+ start:10269 stop:10394 length:126 start_codon:yes stop_codon:yes gene_type:complete